ncbi:MAG: hypothetical protein IT325_13180 [Anaerolineae bacterium]|nr:hypothetical protein [Anaerolineae bacterium]
MTTPLTSDQAAFLAHLDARDTLPLVEAPPIRLPRTRYRFPDGTVVTCRGIAPVLLIGAQSEADRPRPPAREVQMAGGGVQYVPRRDDEPVLTKDDLAALADPERRAAEQAYADYRARLNQWEIEQQTRMARVLFLIGVEDSPPPAIAQLWQQMGFSGEMDIKYAWLASKLPTTEAMGHFFETVTSLTVATEEGLERAEAMFQSAVSGGPGTVAAAEPPRGAAGDAAAPEAQDPPPAGDSDHAAAG